MGEPVKRDFTKLLDISLGEARHLLERARYLKDIRKEKKEEKPLEGKTLAMIFEKASTRTRLSFEIGMKELGGYALFLSAGETQIGRGEPVKDTARVLSRYVDAIMIRTYSQDTVDELARSSAVPLINGLSDLYHPCQILSDVFTIEEFKGSRNGLRVAYVGDGNNVANSWIEGALLFGFDLAVATPPGYEPEKSLLEKGRVQGNVMHTNDPYGAVKAADVIYTDVWVSMGQEKEQAERRRAFASFRVDEELLRRAKPDAIVMHCLPAHRNEEISETIFERFENEIFTQAENRLHVQKALLEWLILNGA
jgi:ornithine carbamoyltransferase